MESETFQIRVSKLIQKSRKAVRLYSSRPEGQREFTECQIAEWREINTVLLQGLLKAVERPCRKGMAADIYALRDEFYTLWRAAESDLHIQHRLLITAAENADFTKTAILSRQLIMLKSKIQAAQAAHFELQDILDKSHVAQPSVELSNDFSNIQEPNKEERTLSNVIPLRRKIAS